MNKLKIAAHLVCFLIFGYPALLAGYVTKMIRDCFSAGSDICDAHFDISYEAFFGEKK